jgi:acylphosphatase
LKASSYHKTILMITVYLLIKGKVQGVFYRASAKEKAEALQVKGWVKNTKEGNVEVVASGSQEAIDQFIAWCYEGPRQANVVAVEVKAVEQQVFDSFRIIRD